MQQSYFVERVNIQSGKKISVILIIRGKKKKIFLHFFLQGYYPKIYPEIQEEKKNHLSVTLVINRNKDINKDFSEIISCLVFAYFS